MRRVSYGSYTTVDEEPEEVLADVEEAGFGGFEILSEGGHDLRREEVVERFAAVDTDLRLTVHAPISDMNFGSLNGELWRVVVNQTVDVIEAAAEIGAERVNVHPGHYSPIGKRYRDRADRRNLEALRILGEAGEEGGVAVSVENLGGVDVFMGRTADELFEMAEETGIGATLDMGHAFITGELAGFAEHPDRIDHVHIHDNEGERDQHLAVGKGRVPFGEMEEFFEMYGGVYVVEGRDLEEGERSLRAVERLLGS